MKKLIGNLPKGLVFVLSAPAGTGKTTLVKMLKTEFPCVKQSVSFTTRPKRMREVEGVDYHFVDSKAFEAMEKKGDFLEKIQLYGQAYGTSKAELEKHLLQGYHVFLVIDTQGALFLKEQDFEASYIFIAPPSMDELKRRLQVRNTENAGSLEQRLKVALQEVKKASFYDYHLVNEDLNNTYRVLKSILIAKEYEKLTQLKKEGKVPWNHYPLT